MKSLKLKKTFSPKTRKARKTSQASLFLNLLENDKRVFQYLTFNTRLRLFTLPRRHNHLLLEACLFDRIHISSNYLRPVSSRSEGNKKWGQKRHH